MPPLYSSVIVGLVWGLWHLPLFLIPGKVLNEFYHFSKAILILFPLFTVGMSVIYSWIFNKTGGSVFLVILLHGMTNWSFETFFPNSTFFGLNITYGLIIITGTVVIFSDLKNWIRCKTNVLG